jgi:hypothetical protein
MAELQSSHPNDEWLVAYLTTSLSDTERHGIDTHLHSCDLCVAALSMMQRRLSIAADIPTAVPASVSARVAGMTLKPAAESFRPHPLAWLSALLDRVSTVIRFPVLVPAAVAAVALLVVVTQSSWMNPLPQQERSRSINMREILRVTASEAFVRGEPTVHTAVLATLKRGARVEVVGEEGEWYQVVLPDGKEGWMERNAFE